MDEDFHYQPNKPSKVVYPTLKLWHLAVFFAVVLPIVYYFK